MQSLEHFINQVGKIIELKQTRKNKLFHQNTQVSSSLLVLLRECSCLVVHRHLISTKKRGTHDTAQQQQLSTEFSFTTIKQVYIMHHFSITGKLPFQVVYTM